ncbi:MAG TPA: SsrA-binding protein SmpB [Chloroflexota bacterium]|jgi:SsrA-binding protein|nr:SsrA-binding protein SmpB [Chloroflexota bacterium]
MDRSEIKVIALNRRARHDYFILDTYEAGIVLTGPEIKSVRAGNVSLQEGFARIENGEAWLEEVYIAPYQFGGWVNPPSKRRRKLLLHREEIRALQAKTREKGLTLVPLRLYLKRGRAKVELGLARGKHLYDKREAMAKREAERAIERALRR